MSELLILALRITGIGLILLAFAHIPIGRRLGWREDASKLSPVNAAIFHVHTFFICLVLVLMGVPCLLDPNIFLVATRAGAWISWSFAAFWAIRLYCQWFVYGPELWRGKPLETFLHGVFTLIWSGLTAIFTACGLWQLGWIG